MLKKLVLLAGISLNCLIARDFQKETGDYSGALKPVKKLTIESDQVSLGNLILLFKQVHKLKAENDSKWMQGIDTIYALLKEINEKQTLECRELALRTAQKYNFEQLWTARHSLYGVTKNHSKDIIATIPQILMSIQAAGKIKRILDLKHAFSAETLFVAQGKDFFIPFKEMPFGQRRVTVQLMENDTNPTDITAYHADRAATQASRTLPIGRLQLGFPNTLNDFVRVTTPFLAQHFNINKLEKKPLQQTAFLVATALTFYYNWSNDKEVIHPGLMLGLNISTLVTTALQIAPVINSMTQEFHKPCPLALMMRKFKQDQEEAQEEEENDQDDQNEATNNQKSAPSKTIIPSGIAPEYTARMVDGEIHIEKKQPK